MKKIAALALLVGCSKLPSQATQELPGPEAVANLPAAFEEHKTEPGDPGTLCPTDMRLVSGEFCPKVEQKCLRWLDENQDASANSGIGPMRCAEFQRPTECLSSKRKTFTFCQDTYEWPNRKGVLPPVDVSWVEARAKCVEAGKRLCTADEWTFACEGEEMRPYPYGDGYHRDEKACDQEHEPMPDPSLPKNEWPKHYHAHPSGMLASCKGPFGAFDQVANVDEWVFNERGNLDKPPYVSGLKGGYWSYRIRSRCRPMTDVHGPNGFTFYQIGFRCCKDVTR